MRRTALFVLALTSCTIDNPVGTNDDAAVADTPDAPVAPADVPGSYRLTVEHLGCGEGTVTSDPVGIDCGGTCLSSFAPGTSVALTATATTGRFVGFGGACTGADCTLPMTADRAVTATFTDITWSHLWSSTDTTGAPTGYSTQIRASALDAAGNTVLGGYYDSELVLEGAMRCPELEGVSSVFIASLSPTGAVRWVQCEGGPGSAEVLDIAVDPATGDSVTIGWHTSSTSAGDPASLDFGGGPLACPTSDGGIGHFLVRLRADGTHVWSRTLCDANLSSASVAIAPNGQVVVGHARNRVVAGTYVDDVELMVLDAADGTTQWSRVLSGTGASTASVHVGADADQLYAGLTITMLSATGTADLGGAPLAVRTGSLDPRSMPVGATAIGAYALADGTFRWQRLFDMEPGSAGALVSMDELVVTDDGPVLDGSFTFAPLTVGTSTFTPTTADPYLSYNLFVAAIARSDGAIRWSRGVLCALPSVSTGYGGTSLDVDSATSEVVLVGGLEGTCDLGEARPLVTTSGARDGFALRIAADGTDRGFALLAQPPDGIPGSILEWDTVAVEGRRVVLAGLLRGGVDRCGERLAGPDGVNESILVLDAPLLGGLM